eukprot:1146281-Pyramimonas_sp.AAC.1
MEAGWDPQQATSWDLPDNHPAAGDTWKFDDEMYSGIAALDSRQGCITDFKQTLKHGLWQKASQHFCGAGLSQGVDC